MSAAEKKALLNLMRTSRQPAQEDEVPPENQMSDEDYDEMSNMFQQSIERQNKAARDKKAAQGFVKDDNEEEEINKAHKQMIQKRSRDRKESPPDLTPQEAELERARFRDLYIRNKQKSEAEDKTPEEEYIDKIRRSEGGILTDEDEMNHRHTYRKQDPNYKIEPLPKKIIDKKTEGKNTFLKEPKSKVEFKLTSKKLETKRPPTTLVTPNGIRKLYY